MARVKLGEATTNSQGIAVLDYTGVGAGEVEIVAFNKERALSSEIYSIYDTIWYDNNIYTSTQTFDQNIGSTSFAVEFDVLPSANNSQCWFRIGVNNSNTLLVGLIYSTQQGIRVRSNGTDIATEYVSTRAVVGETSHIKFTYEDGVMTYNDGDETITLTNTTITPTQILNCTISNAELSNIKLYTI